MKDRDDACSDTDHPAISQALQDAAYAFSGGANILCNFLVRHVECDASAITGGLPMFFRLVNQKLCEFGLRIRRQCNHT